MVWKEVKRELLERKWKHFDRNWVSEYVPTCKRENEAMPLVHMYIALRGLDLIKTSIKKFMKNIV